MKIVLSSLSRKTALISIFTATALSTNYLMIGIVNVKLMDLIVFLGGFLFGTNFGITVGTLTWIVYGTINPYGSNLPTLAATIMGEAIYGIAGGICGKRIQLKSSYNPDYRFIIIGFLSTFLYDLFTNIAISLILGIPIQVVLISGIPFALLHELSNAAFFGFGLPPLVKAIYRVFGE